MSIIQLWYGSNLLLSTVNTSFCSLSSSLLSCALVSSIFVTLSWKFNSPTCLYGMAQLNLRLSNTSPLFLCLCFLCWFGVMAGWHPVSVLLNAIMSAVAACTATWFTFIYLHVPNWDILLLTLCNYSYLHICKSAFVLYMFQTRLHYIYLQLIYMTGTCMGMANYIIIFGLIGQCYYTYMYQFVIKYQWREYQILIITLLVIQG